jgi:hypothetical protein
VFRSFAADAATRGLLISLETIESKAPPEPDILCQVGGLGPVAFELAARGHIRRVWIYDISRRNTVQAIKFVYPTYGL